MKKSIITIGITIIFGILFLLYATGIGVAVTQSNGPIIIVAVFAMVFIGIMGTLIYNMIQRLKEIKEEDQDDISKY